MYTVNMAAIGTTTIYYYSNYADAVAQNLNAIAFDNNSYVIGSASVTTLNISYNSYTNWRVAPPNTGLTSIYANGYLLPSAGGPTYYLYPVVTCFLEGTTVLCSVDNKETYLPIESITRDTLVKTSRDGYKKVEIIGKGTIHNSGNDIRDENRLYKCSISNYPQLTTDLYITGCHSILVDKLSYLERQEIMSKSGRIFVTDDKYRLPAAIDYRSEPWNSEGIYTIWHIALENTDNKMNYGIYVNGGLLVETTSINFLKNHSNLTLL
jgi:hypothetical protein